VKESPLYRTAWAVAGTIMALASLSDPNVRPFRDFLTVSIGSAANGFHFDNPGNY
jgi:hypothetical protein